jgi:probable HAF family extracellular repeat protein
MKQFISITLPAMSLWGALIMPAQTTRYAITDLGTMGGSYSNAFGINNAGHVGGATTIVPGEGQTQHGFLWGRDRMFDAGTLGPGLNANASGPSPNDELPFLAEINKKDPLNEDYCLFGTGLICIAAVWKDGLMAPLPTLGGNNALALVINARGQLTGFAETAIMDHTCPPPMQLRSEAVIWGPGAGEIHELPPLKGDTAGFALGLNDLGQAVGSSGTCDNTSLFPMPIGPHAVLWDNGQPNDLGALKGAELNTGAAINNRGEVVGGSLVGGVLHAMLWTTRTGAMQDLGSVKNMPINAPAGINSRGEIAGFACDPATFTC